MTTANTAPVTRGNHSGWQVRRSSHLRVRSETYSIRPRRCKTPTRVAARSRYDRRWQYNLTCITISGVQPGPKEGKTGPPQGGVLALRFKVGVQYRTLFWPNRFWLTMRSTEGIRVARFGQSVLLSMGFSADQLAKIACFYNVTDHIPRLRHCSSASTFFFF